jgi:hypothetical protein
MNFLLLNLKFKKMKELRKILEETFGAQPLFSSIDGNKEVWTSPKKVLVVKNGVLHQIHNISDLDEKSKSEIISSL